MTDLTEGELKLPPVSFFLSGKLLTKWRYKGSALGEGLKTIRHGREEGEYRKLSKYRSDLVKKKGVTQRKKKGLGYTAGEGDGKKCIVKRKVESLVAVRGQGTEYVLGPTISIEKKNCRKARKKISGVGERGNCPLSW